MINVICRTNLDLAIEIFPDALPAVPQVGDRIQSAQVWKGGFQLELEVYSVTWKCSTGGQIWIPVIELHVPKLRKWSITQFYEWYAPKVGRSVGSFI